MKATDIKMYISTLSIIKKGQEIECGDFLGGRKVNASQEDALNSMKNAVSVSYTHLTLPTIA